MWQLLWQSDAVRELMDLARSDARQASRVITAVSAFERTGRGDVKALAGRPGELRLRVGDWRVLLYRDLQAVQETILVTAVRKRSEAYD